MQLHQRARPVAAGQPSTRTLAQLREVLVSPRHCIYDRKGELLAALVRLAQRDPEVITVVVACLLPGLRALVARYARGVERSEALGVAVEALCDSIAQYPPEMTSFVAGRLLQLPRRRLQQAATVQDAWRRHSRQLPEDANGVGAGRVELPATALLRLAVDAGVLTAPDAWLIYATRVAERTVGWAAQQLGLSYEAAKKRRQRAETPWATWWAPERWPRSITSFSIDPPHKEELT